MRRSIAMVLATATVALAAAATASAAVPDKWGRWGTSSGPRDTTIRSLDFTTPATLYGASESDGIYTSPTALGPWSQQNGGLDPQTGAQSVRQVVASQGVLYAATSAGLFTSSAGSDWAPVGQGPGPRKLNQGGIQSVIVNGPGDLLAAVAGAASPGIYYSSDNGANWDKASGLPQGEHIFYMTTGTGGAPWYAAGDSGVFISINAGRSWALSSDGIPPGETTLRVAVAPDDPSHLYASTSSNVYRSKNGGVTWTDAGGTENQYLPSGGKRAFVLAPSVGGQFGPERAAVGTEQGVWGTLDDGAHWKPFTQSAIEPGDTMNRVVWALAIGLGGPEGLNLMAGTQGFGVYANPLQEISGGSVTIAPTTGLKPGTELTSALGAIGGTAPFFYTYQWKRCNSASCTPSADIAGATSDKYTIPNSDAALPNVRYALQVKARNLVKPAEITLLSNFTSTNGVAALPGTNPRPSFVAADQPSLSPTNSEAPIPPWGTVYTINNGKWRTEASATQVFPTFKYRWQRCDASTCTDIVGQTGQTYTTTPKDISFSVKGLISGTTANGSSEYFLAGTSNTIINKFPVNTVPPKIVGDPFTGVTVSSAAGGWDGFDMTFERRWLRCEADGLGCNPTNPVVTGSTYPITAADLGKRLQLEVTAVAEDPNQDRRTVALSEQTPVITDPPPGFDPGGTPVVEPGTGPTGGNVVTKPIIKIKRPRKLKVGSKLSVPAHVEGFSKIKYQWLRNGKKIKGATKRIYKIRKKDRGKKIKCRLTLTPTAGPPNITVTTKPVKVPRKKRRR